MSGVMITSKTPQGRVAILQHLKEQQKASWVLRKQFEVFYEQKIIEQDEKITVAITHKNNNVAALIPYASMIIPIIDALTKNYATNNKDYTLEEI